MQNQDIFKKIFFRTAFLCYNDNMTGKKLFIFLFHLHAYTALRIAEDTASYGFMPVRASITGKMSEYVYFSFRRQIKRESCRRKTLQNVLIVV
ncbi:MAG TPA: hypothetical protein DCE65_06120 [Clostridiales bacterium]|nr:hypothetical protein [Clostridiales bacterium]